MAYALLEDLTALLPENITIGNNTSFSVSGGDRSSISVSDANRFLHFATQFVDSRLHAYYLTPLKRIVKERQAITANVGIGSCDIQVMDAQRFVAGACVRLSDDNGEEISKILDIPAETNGVCNLTSITLAVDTVNAYDAGSNAFIEMLVYPDPIPLMTARFAVGFIYDRLFSADAGPDVANYGVTQRNEAKLDLDSILTGLIRLEGQEFTGRRFLRAQLLNAISTTGDISFGQSKE
jgi:hypothetical protein